MKKIVLFVVLLFCVSTVPPAAFAAQRSGEQDLKMQQADLEYKASQAAAPESKKPSRTGLTVIPQYYYSGNSAMTTNLKDGLGGRLKLDSGHANGGGFVVQATKEFSESFALNLQYFFVYMKYSGGALQPDSIPGLKMDEDIDVTSHGIGLSADVGLDKFGRLQASFIQGFDDYSGNRRSYIKGVHVNTNSMDNFSDRITSLMLWYEYDAPLNEAWTLTPYAGWRSVYADLENPMGKDDPGSANSWVHFVSGGLKLGYRDGLFGLGLRAGVNYRTSKDDVPGYTIRFPAANVGQPNYNAMLDRTVASFGATASYVFPGRCVVFGGYDGFGGEHTQSHVVSAGLVFPF